MAKSKAKKKRDHQLRNTGRDLSIYRGTTPDFSTMMRRTKTKKESLLKEQTKHKKRPLQEKDIPLSKDRFFMGFYCSVKNSFQV
ncbi:hypothetical protein [Rossellomorea aquimaris]|uniref:hypothetical protein n=1 Tax=Rossellomorea aquimaris TaxID=189382 RepID=UPI001CFCFD2D|nr:hypothetical protein [Rossellomorea aquimaris]